MYSITIPLWMLVVGIGIPFFCLTALIIGLVRAKLARKQLQTKKALCPTPPGVSHNHFNADIYKMILDQQIDAVFLSLSTIIETEKFKLKALMGCQNLIEPDSPNQSLYHGSIDTSEQMADAETETSKKDEMASKIGAMAKNGMTPKEIARELKLSLSEVVLALRFHSRSNEALKLGGQLEAVA